jgi:hypothetical protein
VTADTRRPPAGTEGQVSRRGGDDRPNVRRLTDSRRERRERLFPGRPEVVEYLEGLDRRREAARRLQRICEDVPHGHLLGCHDPQEMTG